MKTATSLVGIPALLVGFATPSLADWGVSHSCSKPYDRTNQYSVDAYKSCIEDFVSQQEGAIRTHSNAGNSAIDDWNSFASGY